MDEITESREDAGLEKRWNYEELKTYLKTIANNPEALLPQNQYPAEIEFSGEWHQLLNKMRADGKKDGNERLALLGYRRSSDSLLLQMDAAIGAPKHTPDIEQQVIKAKREHGIDYILGDIHSHPAPFVPSGLSFSTTDLLRFVYHTEMPFVGLVTPSRNFFVFASKDTRYPPPQHPSSFREIFMEGIAEFYDMTFLRRHNLVKYKGSPGQSLSRVFPKPRN